MSPTLEKTTQKPAIDGFPSPLHRLKDVRRSERPATEAPPAPATAEVPAASVPAVKVPAKPRRIKRIVGYTLLAAAVVMGGRYGYSYWQWAEVHESTDNAFIDAHIVQVSSRVNGHVSKVYVEDNQFVHSGDVLVELDTADFQALWEEAHGKVVAAQADLLAAKSAVEEAKAQVNAADATVAQTKAELARRDAELQRAAEDLAQYTSARDRAAVSSLEWGKADTGHRTALATAEAARKAVAAAEAQANQARSQVEAREGQVAVAEAQIKTAQATAEKAKLNLSYTKVTASQDGRVTRKSVEPGNYVIPGQPLFALVAPDVWVTANFKETQLAKMKPGQPVEIEVDAYPGMKLKGHVDSIQQGSGARFSLLPPENATGNYVKVVQRVPVKIEFDEQPAANDPRTLGPGMSVVPIVHLD